VRSVDIKSVTMGASWFVIVRDLRASGSVLQIAAVLDRSLRMPWIRSRTTLDCSSERFHATSPASRERPRTTLGYSLQAVSHHIAGPARAVSNHTGLLPPSGFTRRRRPRASGLEPHWTIPPSGFTPYCRRCASGLVPHWTTPSERSHPTMGRRASVVIPRERLRPPASKVGMSRSNFSETAC
jgi:hypothetical protein